MIMSSYCKMIMLLIGQTNAWTIGQTMLRLVGQTKYGIKFACVLCITHKTLCKIRNTLGGVLPPYPVGALRKTIISK